MKQTIKEMLRELEEEHRKSLPPGQRLTATIGQTASFVVALTLMPSDKASADAPRLIRQRQPNPCP
jgi:hypothetical protein